MTHSPEFSCTLQCELSCHLYSNLCSIMRSVSSISAPNGGYLSPVPFISQEYLPPTDHLLPHHNPGLCWIPTHPSSHTHITSFPVQTSCPAHLFISETALWVIFMTFPHYRIAHFSKFFFQIQNVIFYDPADMSLYTREDNWQISANGITYSIISLHNHLNHVCPACSKYTFPVTTLLSILTHQRFINIPQDKTSLGTWAH